MAFLSDSIYWVEVEKVVPNPFQPRREFDQGKLQELSDSIRMYGVLQPLTVTRKEVQREDGTFYSEYELIAGERRLRASKLAGLQQVPVIIRDGEQTEQEKLELAIIENLQREDLNAIDRAVAFRQLTEQFGLSHADVAKKVGRSREYVSNSIRLLGLPENIQQAVKVGDLMEGHARTLLMISDRPEEMETLFREIMLKKMSVREVERIVRKLAIDKVKKKHEDFLDPVIIDYEKQFTETLGTRVQIQKTEFGGKLTIDYFSEDDLDELLRRVRDEVAASQPADALTMLGSHTPLNIKSEESEGVVTNSMAQVTTASVGGVSTPSIPETETVNMHDFILVEGAKNDNTEDEQTTVEQNTPVIMAEPALSPLDVLSRLRERLAQRKQMMSEPEEKNVVIPVVKTQFENQVVAVVAATETVKEEGKSQTGEVLETTPTTKPATGDTEEDDSLYSISRFTI